MKKRKRRFYPGMLVRIAKDCRPVSVLEPLSGHPLSIHRPEGAATGAEAVYEGRFNSKTGRRYKGPRGLGMPRLRLEDGSHIWGYECYWLPLKEAQAVEASLGIHIPSREAKEWDRLVDDLQRRTQIGETPEASPTATLTE